MFLIIFDNMLETGGCMMNLKHCYKMIKIRHGYCQSRGESEREFEELKESICEKMFLSGRKKVYIFLKEGVLL
jgi:hypothetical protein